MLNAKWLAIGLCIVFVLGAYLTWNHVIGQFNPNPVTTSVAVTTESCSTLESCNGFSITSADLTVRTAQDIVSQILNMRITTDGSTPMSKVQVFIDNVSVGIVNGPFAPGQSEPITLGIPTTVTIVQGNSYGILVEGTFVSSSSGQSSSSHFEKVDLVAH